MLKSIQHIEPSKVTTDPAVQQVIHLLLNIIEQQAARIEELEHKVQELESEVKRLKTGQGNQTKGGQPKLPQPRPEQPKAPLAPINKNHKTGSKNEKITIDRQQCLEVDKSQLPGDAVFKGYREVLVQNLVLKRDNVLYKIAQYYSPGQNKTYSASVPGYCGEFGAELRALLQTLHHVCDVTEGSLQKLVQSAGVQISSGSINNILLSNSEQMQQERKDILRAGLESSPYAGMDGTKSFESGTRQSTQIISGEYFTVYSTQPGKSRLDILCALQGICRSGQLFAYNSLSAQWLEYFQVGEKHRRLMEKLFHDQPALTLSHLIEQLDKAAPKLVDSKIFERIADALALGHYHAQQDFPILQLLMSDQGKEYLGIAANAQAFCWLHDERHYRMLNPKLNIHRQVLDGFLNQYWDFYRQLLNFKELSPAQQETTKAGLGKQFDQIFTQKTCYDNLDSQIQKTLAKKEQLLLVLKYPFMPLHNNASELAVRRKVRKRDISLHTMSAIGTKTQDAFMTVVHTAAKLGISAFDYIADRLNRNFLIPSLSDSVRHAYLPVTA